MTNTEDLVDIPFEFTLSIECGDWIYCTNTDNEVTKDNIKSKRVDNIIFKLNNILKEEGIDATITSDITNYSNTSY